MKYLSDTVTPQGIIAVVKKNVIENNNYDDIIFDIGHQRYVFEMLYNMKEKGMFIIRTEKGRCILCRKEIRLFCPRAESRHIILTELFAKERL